ncbi:hypothetical protein BV372_34775 [Nostoc sp. T09]|uniref:hypothetical protein n=1 Tax=Nostoc sp. T09 TaxID=1932621 RepID=UPI000A3ABFD7|nr:hypothetical protein [Nostoc sp. T09]OUL17645.1 hypothetical protein BV372_34775 [Nostoc sp. T09]
MYHLPQECDGKQLIAAVLCSYSAISWLLKNWLKEQDRKRFWGIQTLKEATIGRLQVYTEVF